MNETSTYRNGKFHKWLATIFILAITSAAHAADHWKLVWSDEFNYTGLPDTNKWGYEEGFVRNHERQYYTVARAENARVENGCLILECRKEHYTPTNHAAVEYTSASLTTFKKESWQYGRLEMRAKLPRGSGVWPAFWTVGTNHLQRSWPACGEIDIMEFIGVEPKTVHGTVHHGLTGKDESDGGSFNTNGISDDFHIYAVEWSPEKIDFYYDNVKYHTTHTDIAGQGNEYNPFRAPHFIILNFALGGWGGPVDDSILPQKYLIDYVRVYQQDEAASP